MKILRAFFVNQKGAAALEFALAAPTILLTVFGILQLGQIFEAQAGLKYAMDEASRYAGIYPRPCDTAIKARFSAKKFGLNPAFISTTISHNTANGVDYADITATYAIKSNFVFFNGPVVDLTEKRRAFQP